MQRVQWIVGLFAMASLGLWLRSGDFKSRPMHTDEAVHAVKLEELWRTGKYIYDPHEYHGPTLYYATLPVLWVSGVRSFDDFAEWQLRIVPVFFGVALIALLALVVDGLGRWATIFAGLFLAVSTAFVFYSRYYIQEMILVFATILAIAAFWRMLRSGHWAWAILGGAALGLMHATKETCIIAMACMGLAAMCSLWGRFRGQLRRIAIIGGLIAIPVAALVSITFYSSFFQHAAGPLNSIRTYATYFDRAGNHGLHNHPWTFYFERLLYWKRAAGPMWSEWPIFALALVGIGVILAAQRRPQPEDAANVCCGRAHSADGACPLFLRFILIYTLANCAVYTALSYKTPWCMLGFWQGFILLAGCGAASLCRLPLARDSRAESPPRRLSARHAVAAMIGIVTAAIPAALLTQQSTRANQKFASDNRNPYVYAHPLRGVVDLADWTVRLSAAVPEGRQMLVRVYTTDAWPLPWYLRSLRRVGYWETLTDDVEAPIVIAWPEFSDALAARFGERYRQNRYGLRPGLTLTVFTRQEEYAAFVDQQRK